MAGTKCIITGVPGVGKTTVITEALRRLEAMGVSYANISFGSFMVEKGFVRHLSTMEIEALAERVGTINCTSCGGTVDIRHDHACPYCRSALSLLDPQAVDKALARHGSAARQAAPTDAASPDALADALVALERNRAREERARQRERLEGTRSDEFDLLTAGIEMVWSLLRR